MRQSTNKYYSKSLHGSTSLGKVRCAERSSPVFCIGIHGCFYIPSYFYVQVAWVRSEVARFRVLLEIFTFSWERRVLAANGSPAQGHGSGWVCLCVGAM